MKTMANNFFSTALRIFIRNKSYTVFNLVCLVIGLASAITGVLYVIYMTDFDKFNSNYDRLAEVESLVTYFNGERFAKEPQSASLSEVLIKNVPEIEDITRVTYLSSEITEDGKTFRENGIYADSSFFRMFSFGFKSKPTGPVFPDINSVIITKRLAVKLFMTADCYGKTITLKDNNVERAFMVSGVLDDVPVQSTLQFDFVLPYSRFLADNNQALEPGESVSRIWILPGKNTGINIINSKIKDLIKDQPSTLNQKLFLFPLKEKNLYSYVGERRVWGNMQNVVIFCAVGFSILLIACFNFINLAVAQNLKRYREVGIKKTYGASRSSIILQFISETLILVTAAMIIALLIAKIVTGVLNTIFNSRINVGFLDPHVAISIIFIILFTVFAAGILPALYLSSADPASIMRTKKITGHNFRTLRKSLIIVQFVIPVILIISLLVIKVQYAFINKYDIGVDRDRLLILENTRDIAQHEESFKNDLLSVPGIESVSFTNCIPARGTSVSNEVSWPGMDASKKLHFWCINTDYDYNKTVDVKLVAGRYFDRSFIADSSAFLINDIAAKVMGFDDPVGKEFSLNGKKGTIIGVFRDFHTVDLRGPFTPAIISLNSYDRTSILVKTNGIPLKTLKPLIGKVYSRFEKEAPFYPILYRDLPDFAGLKMISQIVGIAFVIAILLACLGLYGLASFTAEWRSKEIGIRKTNGAGTLSVMLLLVSNYSRWLIVSFLIAVPLSFLIGKMFLGRFYFHAPMPVWVFIAGPATAFIIAILAVSGKIRTVASRNPVESLKYE